MEDSRTNTCNKQAAAHASSAVHQSCRSPLPLLQACLPLPASLLLPRPCLLLLRMLLLSLLLEPFV